MQATYVHSFKALAVAGVMLTSSMSAPRRMGWSRRRRRFRERDTAIATRLSVSENRSQNYSALNQIMPRALLSTTVLLCSDGGCGSVLRDGVGDSGGDMGGEPAQGACGQGRQARRQQAGKFPPFPLLSCCFDCVLSWP